MVLVGVFIVNAVCAFIFTQAVTSPYLLFANRRDIRLINVNRPRNSSAILVSHLEDAAAVDYVYSEGSVFWTDISLEMIKSTSINGSAIEVNIITTGLISPDGLACDWLTHKLYWTDSETKRIEVSNLDGSHRKVLFWEDLDQPRAISLVPMEGWLFWTDWGEGPKIERAGMNGNVSTRQVIVSEEISWPNGLTVDYETRRLFWADAKHSFICSIDYDGKNRQKIVQGNLPHPFALTLHKTMLYWTDWQTRSIHMCNKENGTNRKTLLGNTLTPMDIHVYTSDRQPIVPTPCDINNGGCSHLCLLAPGEIRTSCACPTGVRLLVDKKTCADGAQQILLLARRTDVRRISLDTPDYTDVVLQLDSVKHVVAIDYDPVDGYVYWSDDEVRSIRRARLDGADQEDLITTEVGHPDGIAVDWIARNLYWTDTGTDRIEVARLNGTNRKVLITEGLLEPRAIVVDPEAGMLYWTDWGKEAKIERAALDGTEREILINSDLMWPNGLAIDQECDKLYWGDAQLDKIEMANLDGTGRKVLVSEELPHIFGFSLLGDYIYWTDWQKRSIERVDKVTGGRREVIIDQLPDLMGLKAVNVHEAYGTNLCQINNGDCSHLCLFKPNNTYVCACPMGLELTSNQKTCIVPEAFLLFSRGSDIRRISLETNHNDVIIPLAGVKEAMALDFDINDNRIYWTDISSKTIGRAFMNGSNLEHIVEFGLEYPEGMAVDWVAHNLYWADSGTNRIEVARLDGSSRKVLVWIELNSPRSLALDPSEGFMYWSEWSSNPSIQRAAMDGSKRSTLISKVGRANGLTIDHADYRLYWVDTNNRIIESSDLSGSSRTTIISENVPSPFGLTQYQDFIYWTDLNAESIERANKTTGENRTRIQDQLDSVVDILVFHASRQSGWNLCAINNGFCSHLCLAHPTGRQHYTMPCHCPTHYKLRADNKTCEAPESFMLFSQKNAVSRLVTDTNDALDIILPIHGMKNVKKIAYDPVKNHLYWIDGRTQTIKRAYENGSNLMTVVPNPNDLFLPHDITIDPFSRVMFWTCAKNNIINVTHLDLQFVGVVLMSHDDKPRSMVIHPHKGLIFWTNIKTPPRIERAAFDGIQRTTLFSTNFENLGALAIDVDENRLFWIELHYRRIETADIDGGNRKELVTSQLLQPIALAVHGDYLYWIDRDPNSIERVNKFTGENRERILGPVSQLTDLLSANLITKEAFSAHPCGNKNSGCSHLCLVDNNGKSRCSCPIHLILTDDDLTCDEPPTCTPEHFTCRSGSINCIPSVWRCDGFPECEDQSDEIDCPECLDTEFRCGNGQCIDGKFECDGITQCHDETDEAQCCPKDRFHCNPNGCILQTLVCDGNQDCPDGSDEKPDCVTPYDLDEHMGSKNTSITIGIVIAIVIIVVLVLIVYFCKRRTSLDDESEDCDNIMMVNKQATTTTIPATAASPAFQTPSTLTPFLSNNMGARSHHRLSSCTSGTKKAFFSPHCVMGGVRISSNNGLAYDRNHVTGASSSSSSMTHYPQETLNPPPSPVTDHSQCTFDHCCSMSHSPMSSTMKSYKHYRTRNRPPPPTPCSTDVCDDSEPYQSMSSSCGRHKYCPSKGLSDYTYDSDPYPPPPTPRSYYLSDDNCGSCPPSPSTVRSYSNPYPPPPSPVVQIDF